MGDANIVLTTITSSAMFVLLIQWLKNAKWFPFLQHGAKWASRSASIVLAFFGQIGVSYTWDPTHRVLALAGIPTLAGILTTLWHVANHYALQEIIYQGAVNKTSVTTDAKGSIPARVSPAGAVIVPAPEVGK
jgi:hypothetical protein